MNEEQDKTLMPSQEQRTEALRVAREVLRESKTAFTSGSLGKFDTSDLVDVAEYVVTGAHPLDRYSEPVDKEASS